MIKYFHHYVPLCNIETQDELDSLEDLMEIPFIIDNENNHGLLRLIGRPYQIYVISVSMPNELTTAEKTRVNEQIVNHMIAVLKMADPFTDVIRYKDGFINLAKETDNERENIGAIIKASPGYGFGIEIMKEVFIQTYNKVKAPLLALLAESVNPSIPVHYKILTHIRLLEILYPDVMVRMALLNQYENKFKDVGVSERLFRNAIAEIRTRCAHGISSGGADPFVSQAYQDHPKLISLLKLLREVIQPKINESLGIEFNLSAYNTEEF